MRPGADGVGEGLTSNHSDLATATTGLEGD